MDNKTFNNTLTIAKMIIRVFTTDLHVTKIETDTFWSNQKPYESRELGLEHIDTLHRGLFTKSSLEGLCDGVSARIRVQSRTDVQETGRYLPLVSGWGFWIQHISAYKVVFSSNSGFCKTSGTLKITKQSEWKYGLRQVKYLAYINFINNQINKIPPPFIILPVFFLWSDSKHLHFVRNL